MITSRKVNNKGFTLVEIMIAMFILTVGIMGVTGMFITTIKANKFARNTTVANRLAQNLMEQIKTQVVQSALNDMCPAAGWLTCTKTANTVSGTYQESSISSILGEMNNVIYTVTVVQTISSPIAGLDTVTVSLTWRDAYGSHTTRVMTYIEAAT